METGKGKENANRQKNMLDTVDFNHVQHISFTQSRLTGAVSVILNGLLSYEHPPNWSGIFYAESLPDQGPRRVPPPAGGGIN